MKWTRLYNNLPRIGAALFYIALGALGNSIVLQAGKIDWWKARSNELAAIGKPTASKVDNPAPVTIANSSPDPTRCKVVGKKGDVVIHVLR